MNRHSLQLTQAAATMLLVCAGASNAAQCDKDYEAIIAREMATIERGMEIIQSTSEDDLTPDQSALLEETEALLFASKELLGEYQHRRTGLQEVRFALEESTQGREYEHRLRDFNNDPSTTLADVHLVLDVARARIAERLELQAACKL